MATEVINTAQTERRGREDWLKVEPTPHRAYRCHLLITKDEDGTVSAVVLNLPGIGSCGDSEEDAIANVKEAFRGAIEVYEADGKEIPWKDTSFEVIPEGAKQLRIIIDA